MKMSSLAPYTNAMRIGQGFNSYTQEICIDDAVTILPATAPAGPTPSGRGTPEPKEVSSINDNMLALPSTAYQQSNPLGTNMSQIVTFSSHSIENVSDVMDALNISSSASIKYGTIKGSGSSSFVNENKINESDINYIITVKVTNSSPPVTNEMAFNPIPGMKPERFPTVYGDCFISGFMEGGEFSAIISIKVHDKSRLAKVKLAAELQLAVGPSPVAVGSSENIERNKQDDWKGTEISISVNWSGGGDVKKPDENWDLSTVVAAANQFPSLVAHYSQRTSAILMRYDSLRSFHIASAKMEQPYVILDYSLCDLYTMELFSNFMAYKTLWKKISKMIKHSTAYQALEKSEEVRQPIQADPLSLNLARLECRKAMTLILEETKALIQKPDLALVDEHGNVKQPLYKFPLELERRLPRFVGLPEDQIKNLDATEITPFEKMAIERRFNNPSINFERLVGDSNTPKNQKPKVFCSLDSNTTDELDELVSLRIHAHKHSHLDIFGDFTRYSRNCEGSIAAIGYTTLRSQKSKGGRCNCGQVAHVGSAKVDFDAQGQCLSQQAKVSQFFVGAVNHHSSTVNDHGKIHSDFLPKMPVHLPSFLGSPTSVFPAGEGVVKVVIGYLPGSGCIASLVLYTAGGLKVLEWNKYEDIRPEDRPVLTLVTQTPPDVADSDGDKKASWSLCGFWGTADLVIVRLGAIWRRI